MDSDSEHSGGSYDDDEDYDYACSGSDYSGEDDGEDDGDAEPRVQCENCRVKRPASTSCVACRAVLKVTPTRTDPLPESRRRIGAPTPSHTPTPTLVSCCAGATAWLRGHTRVPAGVCAGLCV